MLPENAALILPGREGEPGAYLIQETTADEYAKKACPHCEISEYPGFRV